MPKHCWHDCGIVYTSNPPQWDEKCCHCSKTRRIHGEFYTPAGHGPYANTQASRTIAEDVGPCVPPETPQTPPGATNAPDPPLDRLTPVRASLPRLRSRTRLPRTPTVWKLADFVSRRSRQSTLMCRRLAGGLPVAGAGLPRRLT